ncbi:MAG: hypothetical protein ABF274_08830 [Nonlabens sp.]|uniref:hypothetical protein n=1 Tax=Nonlabens sp. TaxID=1888209 RepID=UPI00321B8529
MKRFLKLWSYIVNPIFIPSLASLWYFNFSYYSDAESVRLKLYLIVILTAAIPLLIYTILKILGIVQSVHLTTTKERITPLLVYLVLLLILLRGTFRDGFHSSLYYFFLGTFIATLVATLITFLRYKISLHLLACGGVLGFLIMLSFIEGMSLLSPMAFVGIISGLTATSRLSMQAHKGHELIFGFSIGLISQILAFSYSVS